MLVDNKTTTDLKGRTMPTATRTVLQGGFVVDGTGAAGRVADVVMADDRIVAVLPNVPVERGDCVVDARNLIVTPGFVDIHTHYDAQATWDPYLTPSSQHGVTTVIMGNCGVGFAPAAVDKREWLIGLMEGVEDIPGAALTEGIRWTWESFPEFLDALSQFPRVIDVGAQIAHGPLRAYVMGERGANNEVATDDDNTAMARLAEDALRAGAFGFSTSRTPIHKAINGEVVPGTHADERELMAIGAALSRAGHGVFQVACHHPDVPRELEWIARLSTSTGRVVSFNLNQPESHPTLWRDVLQQLTGLPASCRVLAQVPGRAIGVVETLGSSVHPFALHPSFIDACGSETPDVARARMHDDALKTRVLGEEPMPLGGDVGTLLMQGFSRMYVIDDSFDYEPEPSLSLLARAQAVGTTPQALAWDALKNGNMLYRPLFHYADDSLDPLHELHQHPQTRMGLSDAGAHCGAICDGGNPTFMLTHWARDRRRGPTLSLPHIVHRQTQQTAQTYGLFDRGVLAAGMLADVNLIDFDKLRFLPPELVFDLPAGGRRLLQRARGYVGTWKSGVRTVDNDAFTGSLPGALIRAR
jgi:N-acyl-D-amino-acid deacylase